MKLTVKTLKGSKFDVEAEPSNTVAEVKAIIETSKSEFPADTVKLIHSGKVLKDDVTIDSCNIKPNDFLVCMITKAKKKATPSPAAAPKEESSSASATLTTSAPTSTAPAVSTETTCNSTAAAPAASSSTVSAPAPGSSSDEFPAEVIQNLTGMGFPEAEALACLRAAQGNPDVAVEFLTNGIPPTVQSIGGTRGNNDASAAPAGNSSAPLSALRNHPQFDQLRALVQSNPQSLQAVLTQIGEQQPDLLTEINANQPLFLQMMNEPVPENPSPTGSTNPSAPTGGGSRLGRMLGGGANPAQMAQMLSSMNPTELNDMASVMGLTPAQLTATAQMIGQMPPEQFQEFVTQAMNQEGGMGAGTLGGLGGLAGPRQHILRLTEDEMAAVDRLTEMGFDRSEAAQAFLACDKNEALAANLLMDGGFGGQDSGAGAADDTEDMYD